VARFFVRLFAVFFFAAAFFFFGLATTYFFPFLLIQSKGHLAFSQWSAASPIVLNSGIVFLLRSARGGFS
jgi:hypothetical protein